MSEDYIARLSEPCLADIEHAARRLCSKKGVPFDRFKVHVCADYDQFVVVAIEDEEEDE